jgi:YfiH family protein
MIKEKKIFWLKANWSAPNHVKAGTSIRTGGYSRSPYNESNLSLNVGDDPKNVKKNRSALVHHLELNEEPVWLEQTHSEKMFSINHVPENLKADGSYTTKKNRVCVITTADCVPVLFSNNEGTKVAAIHVGWKGICRGIVENAVKIFSCPRSTIVWIGPCISNKYYEIGEDVYSNFLDYSNSLESAFKKSNKKKWYCSLGDIVKILLKNSGINKIHECGLCTYQMNSLFFSYRRDGDTGRTASMIWID